MAKKPKKRLSKTKPKKKKVVSKPTKKPKKRLSKTKTKKKKVTSKPTKKPKKRLSKTKLKKKKVVSKPKKLKVAPVSAPEEFELIEPDELDDDFTTAQEKMRSVLTNARNRLLDDNGIESAFPIIHTYFPVPAKNYFGEIDTEWRVDGVRGEQTSDILHYMQEALDWPVLGEGFWITVGIRFHDNAEIDERTGEWKMEGEDPYKRTEGMADVSSNYRKMVNKARTISAFNAVLERSSSNPNSMIANVEKKFKHKVSQVYVRINWNPGNIQPKRSEK